MRTPNTTPDMAPDGLADTPLTAPTDKYGDQHGDHSSRSALLDITLYPHRSLSPRAGRYILLAIAAVCALASLRFIAIGAWPVAVFVMVDVIALWFAFRVALRAGRVREHIRLTDTQLHVERRSHRVERWAFEPTWVKLAPVRNRRGVEALSLATHHSQVSIGSFLNEDERRDLHALLEDALVKWRAGSHLR